MLLAALAPVQQDYLTQARQMQALSFAVHIPLVCFGIAFPAMILFIERLYHRTGDEVYRTLARRWTRIMVALFAIGVITGTILSFEMGLLWPGFTATFGSVFGLGFAIEGFSFFMEAIFIGIYVYGWDRLSPRAHLASGIPIVITGFTGSWMVIAVNGWMNHPGGFKLVNGRVVDVHPLTALFANSYFWHELIHMYLAGFIVTGFVMSAAYAVGRLRGHWGRYERIAFTIPLTVAALASPVQVLVGDWAGREVAQRQPAKLAALEGLAHTEKGAPIHILGWYSDDRIRYGIPIPKGLSFLAYHDPNHVVLGLDAFPPADRAPVNVVRLAFQTMVGIGTLLALLGVVYVFARWRRPGLLDNAWFTRAVALAGPLSVVALIAGWTTTEVGRQPWVVWHVMRTDAAVTGAAGIPVGYAVLALVYLLVACGVVWILRRLARTARDVALMHLYDVPMVFVLVGLALYVVLGGADFGAAVWQVTGSDRVREHAHEAMAPVWEANHVWLIFVLTVLWTGYPEVFGSIASTLCVALFIAGLGIIARGAAYALRAGAETHGQVVAIDLVSAAASVLTPFALGAAAGGIASGRVPPGNAAGDLFTSWLNPISITIGVLAVVSCAYLAAVFLAADAARSRAPTPAAAADGPPETFGADLVAAFRVRALGAGSVAGALAVVGLIVVHSDAPALYHGLVSGSGLAALIVSVLAGVAALALVYGSRFEAARYTAALAVAAIIAGWALAQQPVVLPGLTIRQAAAPHDSLVTLIVAVLAGGLILFPSLALLFRLVLRGRLGYGAPEPAEAPPRREIADASRTGLLARAAGACLVVGFGLLTVAEGSVPHAFGVVSLLAFIVLGFAAAVPA